jgi:hypothetical protein
VEKRQIVTAERMNACNILTEIICESEKVASISAEDVQVLMERAF